MILPTPPPGAPQAIGLYTGWRSLFAPRDDAGDRRSTSWLARQSYGCGLPADTLVDAMRTVRPRVLWLSVSTFEAEQRFLADYATLYGAAQELGVAVLVGGRMLTGELRARIQYSRTATICDTPWRLSSTSPARPQQT